MALAAAPGRRRSARLQGLPDEPGPSGRPAVPPGDGLQVPAAGTGAGTDHQASGRGARPRACQCKRAPTRGPSAAPPGQQRRAWLLGCLQGGKKRGRKAAAEAERAGARAENQKPFKKQRGARQPGAGPTRAAEQARRPPLLLLMRVHHQHQAAAAAARGRCSAGCPARACAFTRRRCGRKATWPSEGSTKQGGAPWQVRATNASSWARSSLLLSQHPCPCPPARRARGGGSVRAAT